MDRRLEITLGLPSTRKGNSLFNHLANFKDIIDLKTKYQVLHVKYHRSKQRILINVNEPLKTFLPLIAKKFQLDNIQDFSIVVKTQSNEFSTKFLQHSIVLDLNKSIRDLGLSTEQIFFLKHSQDQMEDLEEENSKEISSRIFHEFSLISAQPEQPQSSAPVEVVDLQVNI
jgi:hypothetical protein